MHVMHKVRKTNMEKQVRIAVKYGKTVNLGDYESKRIDMSVEVDVDQKDCLNEQLALYANLKAMVNSIIEDES